MTNKSQGSYSGTPFNYLNWIPSPSDLDVRIDSSALSQIGKNGEAVGTYLDILTTTPALGNKFWVPTLSKCNDKSKDGCAGKKRYIYMDHVPSGVVPCTAGFKSGMKGLVPSLVGDIITMVPSLTMTMLGEGNGNTTCSLQTRPVGQPGPYAQYGITEYKNESRCAPPPFKIPCLKEVFQGHPSMDSEVVHPEDIESRTGRWLYVLSVLVLLGVIVLYFLFSNPRSKKWIRKIFLNLG